MFCQFGALNSTLDQSSLSIHESFIESEFGNVKSSNSGTQSSRELDQNRAIQLQKGLESYFANFRKNLNL